MNTVIHTHIHTQSSGLDLDHDLRPIGETSTVVMYKTPIVHIIGINNKDKSILTPYYPLLASRSSSLIPHSSSLTPHSSFRLFRQTGGMKRTPNLQKFDTNTRPPGLVVVFCALTDRPSVRIRLWNPHSPISLHQERSQPSYFIMQSPDRTL